MNGDLDPYRTAVGALQRMSSSLLLEALQIPRSGGVFDLGLELNMRIPAWSPAAMARYSIVPYVATAVGLGGYRYATEVVTTGLHHGTHIDGLAHIQSEGRLFGDRVAEDLLTLDGWAELGIETVPPIIGRCVVLDIARDQGVAALADGYEISVGDVERAAEGVAIRPGDVVLVRTGKIREFHGDPAAFVRGQPGIGVAAAVWLYDRGMAVLGMDTPPEPAAGASAPLTHIALLVERGVHIIEDLYLEELSEHGITEALFVCSP